MWCAFFFTCSSFTAVEPNQNPPSKRCLRWWVKALIVDVPVFSGCGYGMEWHCRQNVSSSLVHAECIIMHLNLASHYEALALIKLKGLCLFILIRQKSGIIVQLKIFLQETTNIQYMILSKARLMKSLLTSNTQFDTIITNGLPYFLAKCIKSLGFLNLSILFFS